MSGKGNVATRSNGARPPAILVGETYTDVARNIMVRVIDRCLPARSPGVFVVEPADGSRPGERWLRIEGELQATRTVPVPHPAAGRGRTGKVGHVRHGGTG